MSKRNWIFLTMFVSVGCFRAAAQDAFKPPVPGATPEWVLVDRYCVTCQNQKLKTAGLMLDSLNIEKVSDDAVTWEKVVRKLRSDAMPPAGAPRPDKASSDSLAA